MADRSSPPWMGAPFLEHYPGHGGPAELLEVWKLPFTLGRGGSHDRSVSAGGVSRDHAEIVRVGDVYVVRDLGSTNGTYLNGRAIIQASLVDGDIIHLGDVEFRFRCLEKAHDLPASPDVSNHETLRLPFSKHDSLLVGNQLLRELFEREAVRTVFQPIVALDTRQVMAFEALGRGTHPDLPDRPTPLLELADRCQASIQLSQLWRRHALADAERLAEPTTIFLNVHPAEIRDPDFLLGLPRLDPAARHRFVVEITESCVADVALMRQIREGVHALGYGFAYDDFGAGQARLLELTDVPPDFLKLDRGVIEGVDQLMPRRHLVRALVRLVSDLGVRVIAEGVEDEATARTCEALGCHLGQGFFFGAPRDLEPETGA